MEKLRPAKGKMILIALITFLFGAAVLFLTCFRYFTTFPWEPVPYIISIGYTIVALVSIILYFNFYYYVIEKDHFVVRKITKELFFNYKDIVYINQNRKSNKSSIDFYTNKGHTFYLTPDKEDKLYQHLIANCPNLMGENEFKRKYPNANL